MSWDIIIFNTKQKISSIEEIDDTQLEPTDFCAAFESHFKAIAKVDDHVEVSGNDFTIEYFQDDDKVNTKTVSLYGKNGFFELVIVARKFNWLLFDTGSGQLIDLDNPTNNGYEEFQHYLRSVLNKSS